MLLLSKTERDVLADAARWLAGEMERAVLTPAERAALVRLLDTLR